MTTNNDRIAYGGAVKAIGGGKVAGMLIAFTDARNKDLQGEYFQADTDFGLDGEGWRLEGKPTLYHHGMDRTLGTRSLGEIIKARVDDVGIWVEAQLNMRDDYEKAIYRMVEQGKLSWSSGALPQGVAVLSDGKIARWPVIEGSLTPTPAEPFRTGIHSTKALPSEFAIGLTADESEQATAAQVDVSAPAHKSEALTAGTPRKESATMDVASIIREALVAAGETDEARITSIIESVMTSHADEAMAMSEADPAMLEPEYEDKAVSKAVTAAIQKLINAAVAKAKPAKSGALGRLVAQTAAQGVKARAGGYMSSAPVEIKDYAVKRTYDRMSAQKLSLMVELESAIASPQYRRLGDPDVTLRAKGALMQALANKALDDNSRDYDDHMVNGLHNIKSMKTDELDNTLQTGYGLEFVSTLWREQLIADARQANRVASMLRQITMDRKIEVHPVQGDRGTVYFVPETITDTEQTVNGSTIPDSKVATDNVTFTAKKLSERVGWSAELEEDSIIKFSDYVLSSLTENMARAIDHVVLAGDTATSGNINYDGGTPDAKSQYMIFNGILKAGLANGSDNLGAITTLDDLNDIIALLNIEISTGNQDKLGIFVDPYVANQLRMLGEVTTFDKRGEANATIRTGQVLDLFGTPVISTPTMLKTASDGKITHNAGGTLGRAVVAYLPGWILGFRREAQPYLWRAPDGESWQMTLSTRLDLQTNQMSGIASLLYNIGL